MKFTTLLNNSTLFSNPKFMAGAGLIAMLPKFLVTSLLTFGLACLLKKPQFINTLFIVLYQIVGAIIDVALYRFKDPIWQTLPSNIPPDWEITPEQLLEYAKHLPKIRLMRFFCCWILIPFMTNDNGALLLSGSDLLLGIFFAAFFDAIWLQDFKIKRPNFPIKFVNNNLSNNSSHIFDDLEETSKRLAKMNDPCFPGSPAWYATTDSDPCTTGSTAWYVHKSFNSK
jgi:hypothetical protein